MKYYGGMEMERALEMMEQAQALMEAYKLEVVRARETMMEADELTGGCFASLTGFTADYEVVCNLVKDWGKVKILCYKEGQAQVAKFLGDVLGIEFPFKAGDYEINGIRIEVNT